MTIEVETSTGMLTLNNAMIDVNGTDLVEGIEVKYEDGDIREFFGYVDLDDEESIEAFLNEHNLK